MDTPDATRANSALWAAYLEDQYAGLLAPLGGVGAGMALGAAVAAAYTAFWGDVIARMFAANAGEVTRFAQASGADVRPRWSATPLPPTALDEPPPWLRDALDEISRRDLPVSTREPVGAL